MDTDISDFSSLVPIATSPLATVIVRQTGMGKTSLFRKSHQMSTFTIVATDRTDDTIVQLFRSHCGSGRSMRGLKNSVTSRCRAIQ